MLGRAQNFIKIHIKTAHSQLSSSCTALFSLFCYFSTPFLLGWVGEANKQNHYLHRLKEKLASMVPCQEGRAEWLSSYLKGHKQSFSLQCDQWFPGRKQSRNPGQLPCALSGMSSADPKAHGQMPTSAHQGCASKSQYSAIMAPHPRQV